MKAESLRIINKTSSHAQGPKPTISRKYWERVPIVSPTNIHWSYSIVVSDFETIQAGSVVRQNQIALLPDQLRGACRAFSSPWPRPPHADPVVLGDDDLAVEDPGEH
jgi:hypothetical protein